MRLVLVCVLAGTLIWRGSSFGAQAQSDAVRVRAVVAAQAPEFSGTIFVAKNGATIVQESFGMANRQFDVPNTTSTRYRIASVTKLFTASLVLQLHDEGKVDLQKTVESYLPACGGEVGSSANVEQLLNHTSGMADIVAVKSKQDGVRNGIPLYQMPQSVDSIVAKYCSAPLAHRPGTSFFYNNGDYIVLGKIIEQVEGEAFGAVLKRRILAPLGMRDSGMLYQHEIVPRLASAYFTRDDGARQLSNDLPVYDENWYAAGAMYSTTTDLSIFADALFGGRLLKPATLKRLMTPGRDGYGFGAWIYRDDIAGAKYTSVMRPGQIMGTNTVLYRVVEPRLTIILLSNTDRSNVDALASQISKTLIAGPGQSQ